MSKRRRVLVIEPHSDDGAISTGGYLLKHRDIFEYYFLLAVASDFPLHHQEVMTRTTRLAEFSMYCDYLGASWVKPVSGAHQMPLDQDSRLDQFSRKDLVALIENGIQEVEPEILFLTGPSFHHDHTAVYEATIAALRPTARFCPDEVYVSENPTYVHQGNPMVRFHPDTYCTLTDAQLDEKMTMFELCFPSQIRSDDNSLSPGGIRSWARYRGIEARAAYAEAFQTFFRRL